MEDEKPILGIFYTEPRKASGFTYASANAILDNIDVSYGWIISIFETNYHYLKRVIQTWLCNETAKMCDILSCPLYIMYSSEWILFIFGTMITVMRECVSCNDLWPWIIFSRSFRHDFTNQLLKYGTSCVRSISHVVLNGFFLYLAQMTMIMRGCPMRCDLWPWSILYLQGHPAMS